MANSKYSIFFLSWVELKFQLPFRLIKCVEIKRPDQDQLQRIKSHLEAKDASPRIWKTIYEKEIKTTDGGSRYEKLEDKYWKYYFLEIEFQNTSELYDILDSLKLAFNMLQKEIQFGLEIYKPEKGNSVPSYNPLLDNIFYSNKLPAKPIRLVKDDFLLVKQYYNRILNLQNENVINALKSFEGLKGIPSKSDFKTLGYFTIIEQLITHNPKDSGDSLTRQMVAKIPLINRRLAIPINFLEIFGEIKIETVIKKLYSYRSHIAHGLTISFDKEFNIFENRKRINDFIKQLVKSIIISAIMEPDLISDLKKC